MGAHSLTAVGIASALLGKRRVEQTVVEQTVVEFIKRHDGGSFRRAVLIKETGERYWVYSPAAMDAIKNGTPPDELELEPYEPEEV